METIEYWLRSSDGTALYEANTDNVELNSEKWDEKTQSITSRITSLLHNPNSAANRRPLDKNQGNSAAGSAWDDGRRVPHFLDACFFCKGRIRPDRDILMYRGDVPFCGEECREEQLKSDEMKEKRAFFFRTTGLRNRRKNSSSAGVEVRARGPTVAGY